LKHLSGDNASGVMLVAGSGELNNLKAAAAPLHDPPVNVDLVPQQNPVQGHSLRQKSRIQEQKLGTALRNPLLEAALPLSAIKPRAHVADALPLLGALSLAVLTEEALPAFPTRAKQSARNQKRPFQVKLSSHHAKILEMNHLGNGTESSMAFIGFSWQQILTS
jgi:hypothetical protein